MQIRSHAYMPTCGHAVISYKEPEPWITYLANMQICRHADMQTCRHAVTQACRHAGMQSCRHAVISYEEPESGV